MQAVSIKFYPTILPFATVNWPCFAKGRMKWSNGLHITIQKSERAMMKPNLFCCEWELYRHSSILLSMFSQCISYMSRLQLWIVHQLLQCMVTVVYKLCYKQLLLNALPPDTTISLLLFLTGPEALVSLRLDVTCHSSYSGNECNP